MKNNRSYQFIQEAEFFLTEKQIWEMHKNPTDGFPNQSQLQTAVIPQ